MPDTPDPREQIRRILAEADGFQYDDLYPQDYAAQADAIQALFTEAAPAVLRDVLDSFDAVRSEDGTLLHHAAPKIFPKEFERWRAALNNAHPEEQPAERHVVDHDGTEPTMLRWGLNDVMWGDDDTVTILLSGPAGEPYWLELDPERAAVLREDLAGPEQPVTGGQPDTQQADRTVAYRSPGTRTVYCLTCARQEHGWKPATAAEVQDDAACDFCGGRVLKVAAQTLASVVARYVSDNAAEEQTGGGRVG